MAKIRELQAFEILDSRGNPTLSVHLVLDTGNEGQAQVPSGASTGSHEAVELRDGDSLRYRGKGVRKAVANVNDVLAPELIDTEIDTQQELDLCMIELDGTADKSRLGANALLGISCAYAKAAANDVDLPVWAALPSGVEPRMPTPMVNIISGGLHAGGLIEVQDFLVIPHGFKTISGMLEAVAAVHHATKKRLQRAGYVLTGVADEGGWGPALKSNEAALETLSSVIEELGFKGRMSLAVDLAASHFRTGDSYNLPSERRTLSRDGMIDLLQSWVERYPLISIEDGLHEDDWDGWAELTHRLGRRVQLIGDDLFTTNPVRLQRGIEIGAANSVLVKMNQIGTLTETFQVVKMARSAGYRAVISARSGETEDSFLADLAVASGAGQIKVGSITRSERLAKYNRLLEIEERENMLPTETCSM